MDFAYSPHREGGGMVHLPSPTHHHGYGMEIPSSIQQLRRSLSRSPSKSSRFALRKSDSPASPLSPLALARAFSPRPQPKDNCSMPTNSESPFLTQAAPASTKKRFTLRRSAPFRSSPRNRTTSKSPRRALAESTDHGNATLFTSRRISGEENKHMARRTSAEILDKPATDQRPSFTYDLDDKPIRFPLSRSRIDLTSSTDIPAKSSPLKRSDRSDGMMNMDDSNAGSPVAKRRSLHGSSAFGENFNVYDYAPTPRSSGEEPRTSIDGEGGENFLFLSSPAQPVQTPARKPSLRKSMGYQRLGANTSRSNQATDGEFVRPGPAASTTRNRMSLDGSLSFSPAPPMLKYRRPSNLDPLSRAGPLPFLRGGAGGHQPHPLSHALTPSSSLSMMDGSSSDAGSAAPTAAPPNDHPYARSLPIGAARPRPPKGQAAEPVCATPNMFKMAIPDPAPFNSTGFISKKNRNVDDGDKADYIMPDTPSKRNSYPPLTSSPYSIKRQSVIDFGEGPLSKPQFQLSKTQPQFGQPSTPLTVHRHSNSASFGQGVHLFGSYGSNNQRRLSFAGTDGGDDDEKESKSVSPWGTRMEDSQSSNEDMPPTPTKDGSGRRKDNSLRRSTFRQPRASLGTDTFTAPEAAATPSIAIPPLSVAPKTPFDASTPHTPNEAFTPPDPSTLSISGRRASVPFNNSIVSVPFEPATPTTPRDHPSMRAVAVTNNDVDESLAARFDTVTSCGDGEFSKVYKVEKRKDNPFGFTSPAKQVWAVKKTKKPFIGPKDRAKHLKEVEILQRLRGHGHVISIEDSWEAKGHLYIQTEYCDEGNLEHYLAVAGSKSRLDDFRIWKILLELSSVSVVLHLR
jgi:mitosis inhibitor protein kinase SWE1